MFSLVESNKKEYGNYPLGDKYFSNLSRIIPVYSLTKKIIANA